MAFIFIKYTWVTVYLVGTLLITYLISKVSEKHRTKIVIVMFIFLSCFFTFSYFSYPMSNTQLSDINITHSDRILIISPHPDDEALSSAGMINNAVNMGIPVSTVIMTTGDGYKPDVIIKSMNLYPKSQKFINYGISRHSEDIIAMSNVGLNQSNIFFLGYPDGGLQYLLNTNWDSDKPYMGVNGVDHVPYSFAYQPNATYCGESVNANLESIISSYNPTIIIYPGHEDNHPDHWATNAFVEYSTTKMSYKGKKLTYAIHNDYCWNFPWIYAPGKRLTPSKDLAVLKASWTNYNLTSTQINAKNKCINSFSSQELLLGPLLNSFVRQNEIFATYPDTNISISNDNLNLSMVDIPNINVDYTWNHDLIYTGLIYNLNSTRISLETKNGIKKEDTFIFHFRLFNNGNVKWAEIKVHNGTAYLEKESTNSININKPLITDVKQGKLIVEVPKNLFENSTAVMYNVDIVKNGNIDRSDWFKLNIN